MEEQKIGYVYKITNSENDEIYIGSTKNSLKKRYLKHLEKLKVKPDRKLYSFMEQIGISKFRIELLENVNYTNIEQLKLKEQEYIDNLKPSLNCHNALGRNKDKKKVTDKRCYLNHREERLQKVHEYAETHKEEIKERGKLFREKNKDKIKANKSTVCICDICGSQYTKCHKSRHEKSKFHLNSIK